jgi:hypothetical protein
MDLRLATHDLDDLIGERVGTELADLLAEFPVEAFGQSTPNMLLPTNLDSTQLSLPDGGSDADIGPTIGRVGELVDNMVSVGALFSIHAYIIQELDRMSRKVLDVVFMQQQRSGRCYQQQTEDRGRP